MGGREEKRLCFKEVNSALIEKHELLEKLLPSVGLGQGTVGMGGKCV